MKKSILGLAGLIVIACTLISWIPVKTKSAEITPVAVNDSTINEQIDEIYNAANLAISGLSLAVFKKAATGFYNLKEAGKVSDHKSILSIADFDLSSKKKRLWIVDLEKETLILNTWVAHGTFSGGDVATNFSNTIESQKSSVGFYVTAEAYYGKHGLSLRLDGMDNGFNSNARQRAIVVHGADYVSEQTISALGRLGRSQGCPAVPSEQAGMVVRAMEDKTVLFIHSSNSFYTSPYLFEHQQILASK
uniref:murein L,D-transpeptidase catalytic domain family protein n=1 Tax=Pedobacter schmidteae TaxID=2201271 RepID=UPI000EAECC5C|nr:murein L,D-transpeptidase catalytic domain family protein [Pedobacter schmidteae]